jgi:hypothetical protein
LASKSKDLDDAMIREQEANKPQEQAEAKLTDAEKKLNVAEGEKKRLRVVVGNSSASIVQA